MAKLNILWVISCVLAPSLGNRIPRDSGDSPTKPERCMHDSIEMFTMLGKNCPELAPQQNYTESINLIVLSKEYVQFSEQLSEKMELASEGSGVDILIELCNFVNQPNYTKYASPKHILSLDQMCELAHINEKAAKEGSKMTFRQKVGVTRQVCRVYSSMDKIASVNYQHSDSRISKEQFITLKRMWDTGNCNYTLDCDNIDDIHKACSFLNETVSRTNQAKRLGITIDVYEKLVAVRKLYSDTNNEYRLALAKRSCEALNGIKSDGVNLSYYRNALILLEEKYVPFAELWKKYNEATDSKKIPALRNVCNFLKDQKLTNILGFFSQLIKDATANRKI